MLSLDSLPSTKQRRKKRLGRGNASSGNYSGRGMKGQRSRSGGKGGLKLRGLKQSMLAVPKVPGFHSRRPHAQVVNLSQLEDIFESGETVTVDRLIQKGLVETALAPVKILGEGKLTKSLTVQVHRASKSAQAAITAGGGSFEAVPMESRYTVHKRKTEAAVADGEPDTKAAVAEEKK